MNNNQLNHNDFLIWIDCEMTQLQIQNNLLLEIAVLITDRINYNNISPGINLIVHRTSDELENMNPSALNIYTNNGLLEAVNNSPGTVEKIDTILDEWIKKFNFTGPLITVGNSPTLDRALIETQLPKFNTHLSHTMIDITSIKNFIEPFHNITKRPTKKKYHRAWKDIKECKEEATYYKNILTTFNSK